MQVEVITVTGEQAPKLKITPESAADQAALNAIVEGQAGSPPFATYVLVEAEASGTTYSSITFGEITP